jgi:hypothetical protein
MVGFALFVTVEISDLLLGINTDPWNYCEHHAKLRKLVLGAALQWRDWEFSANNRAALDRASLDVQTKNRLAAKLSAGL